MRFELNTTEQETIKKIVESLIVIYGEVDELKRSYTFTPTGLGNNCKVVLKGYNDRKIVFEVEKDITDYDS